MHVTKPAKRPNRATPLPARLVRCWHSRANGSHREHVVCDVATIRGGYHVWLAFTAAELDDLLTAARRLGVVPPS
jgi:hypothetical protein